MKTTLFLNQADNIEAPLPQREDNAERKRVELHLHKNVKLDGVLSEGGCGAGADGDIKLLQ